MMYKYFYESSGGKNAKGTIVDLKNVNFKTRWEINRIRNDFYYDNEQSSSGLRIPGQTCH